MKTIDAYRRNYPSLPQNRLRMLYYIQEIVGIKNIRQPTHGAFSADPGMAEKQVLDIIDQDGNYMP